MYSNEYFCIFELAIGQEIFFIHDPYIASEHAFVDIDCAIQVCDVFQYWDLAFFVLIDRVLSEGVLGDLDVDKKLFVRSFDQENGFRFGKLFVFGRDEDLSLA
jgi:hypothetical protein